MLQQWRKPLTIVINPEGVTIHTRGKNTQFFEANTLASAHTLSWMQALTEFEKNAASIDAGKVRFIISNHYVRYEILAWKEKVFSLQDWQSIAENHMRKLHGDIVEGWKVNVSMQGYGHPIVISAIEQSLLIRLQTLARQYKWTIDAVEPALMSVANSYRNIIKNNAWLIMAESQRVILAEANGGIWQNFSVLSPPTGQESKESLNLIKRNMRTKHQNNPMNVHFFGEHKFQPNSVLDGVKINTLIEHNNVESNSRTLMAELL